MRDVTARQLEMVDVGQNIKDTIFVVTRDVQIKLRVEEYAHCMGQMLRVRLAFMKDVPNKPRREEFALSTVHRGQRRLANMMDVQAKQLIVVRVRQNIGDTNIAVKMDVQIKFRIEEFVLSMGPKWRSAATMDVLNMQRGEDSV